MYKKLTNSLNAKVNIPFAGKYILGGKLIELNDYRGVADAVEVLEKISGISIIRFSGNDIIRHPMVTRIVNAYDKREGNHLYEVPAE